VKIILGTIHELSLPRFGGYANLITSRCLLSVFQGKQLTSVDKNRF